MYYRGSLVRLIQIINIIDYDTMHINFVGIIIVCIVGLEYTLFMYICMMPSASIINSLMILIVPVTPILEYFSLKLYTISALIKINVNSQFMIIIL